MKGMREIRTEGGEEIGAYDKQEQRVSDYIQEIVEGAMGSGDDPVGFLIASHSALAQRVQELNKEKAKLTEELRHKSDQLRLKELQMERFNPWNKTALNEAYGKMGR